MDTPSVQVLMATYNGERYLEAQIDSILCQDDVNVELFVRDDGSTDATTRILDEYQSKHLLRWYKGTHLNAAKGFLELLKKSDDADYYSFSDQDDVWDKDKLKIAIDQLSKIKTDGPLLYYSGLRVVDQNLNFMFDHLIDVERDMHTNFIKSNIAGCTSVFNKALRNVVNEASPKSFIMHDNWVLWVCLALGGNVIIDPLPHINYRQHGDNAVGLKSGIKLIIENVKYILKDRGIVEQCKSLNKCYGEAIVPEYKILLNKILNYKKDFPSRFRFAFSNEFDFKKVLLNWTIKTKIILGTL